MLNVPPIDSRCSDPAFAEKYPGACRYFTRLILKNERSKALADVLVPFKAFAIANGAEVELASSVSGACTPEVLFNDDFDGENGDAEAPNFTAYTLWDCFDLPGDPLIFPNDTDLINDNTIPSVTGEGMFVDLLGTTNRQTGRIRTKDPVAIMVAGQTYKLTIRLSGNLRSSPTGGASVQFIIGTQLDETLNPEWDDVPDDFEFTFLATTTESAKIQVITESPGIVDLGPILYEVTFERICPSVDETSSGVEFSSSKPSVATIDSVTGIATTVAVGKTTISAKWNNQYAYAEIEVVADCDAPVNYLFLIDNSFSMQQNFDGVYPTKLSYAKYLAERFFSSMATTKDQMAFGNFNVEADINVEATSIIVTLNGGVPNVFTTPSQTDLAGAIEFGVEYLNAMDGLKVLVLITDGQYNKGGLPGPIAREFRQSGGIIIVVGVRVFDVYFQLLNEISTKGYFLSAYGAIATAVGTNLIGLKSFLCSGDCPGGAVYGCLTEPLDTQIADPDPLQVQSEY